ncbi:hypothetical protein S7335_778 [Synechococcus sp. PCC 7335]|nr:hypothetical protein S7335_778 [Synechococcus sp. PCC 7335]
MLRCPDHNRAMLPSNPFKWRHFQSGIILLNVRWYLRYGLSYRDIEEMMLERGVNVDHTTIYRWVQAYSPELDKRCRRYLKPTNDSWRTDETYVKVRGKWKYLYRAVDSEGNTLDFMLSAKRDAKAAKRFFKKVLHASHTIAPRVITVDKNAAYPPAIKALKKEKSLPKATKTRQIKYMNNIVEMNHSQYPHLPQSRLRWLCCKNCVALYWYSEMPSSHPCYAFLKTVQMASLPIRHYLADGALVSAL